MPSVRSQLVRLYFITCEYVMLSVQTKRPMILLPTSPAISKEYPSSVAVCGPLL